MILFSIKFISLSLLVLITTAICQLRLHFLATPSSLDITYLDSAPSITIANKKNINNGAISTDVSHVYRRSNSSACHPYFPSKPIKHIFFSHMRKAGGTSIRRYLDRVAETYNLSMSIKEGRPLPTLAEMDHPSNAATLYVTNLREPIARTLSHFRYSARWNCRKLYAWYERAREIGFSYNASIMMNAEENDSFWPTMENAVNITTWIQKEHLYTSKTGQLWDCSSNCYIRWLTNPSFNITNIGQCLDEARKKLLRYHLIIISEKLSDPKYVSEIEKMFGGVEFIREDPFCAVPSRKANAMYPLAVKNETLKDLSQMNVFDTLLYNEFASCPQDSIHFPVFNQSNFFRSMNSSTNESKIRNIS